ncbi:MULTISPECIES: DUF2235 domain-containing protein [Pseudomonadota]|uniref:DUF2235 domain-containing protein n=1 Tax=Pseudomonadota TaxID=1224 RepID=UPI001CA70236|nr:MULTISPECIES: DUF2235 domain-containing protein [Pseudomonadota]MBY8964601.1 DUF2235 domain-containing protein [Algiphilus acroporae]MCI5069572.1 DUF2235 domain-containing protein [Acidovorax sp.]MCI5103259.1 DUF2235 domain-containing protein [Algiphilus sp.]
MPKRIVICADGTWNRPEEDVEADTPTNILRLARAIQPWDNADNDQHVFYDWGIGSYHGKLSGGISGRGIHKNITDAYRYIVQNYTPGAEIFLFGFSRGAYTVRSLCGLINNCGILKRPDANRIAQAFAHYKNENKAYKPEAKKSIDFRKQYSYPERHIRFLGVFDTVGALGIPFSFLGLFDRTDEFYDTKLGPNVAIARHALAIDERREDFEPTFLQEHDNRDIQQVWFAGVHGDIGGGYQPDKQCRLASDFPLQWMIEEAEAAGLNIEKHIKTELKPSVKASVHRSNRHIYRLRRSQPRNLTPEGITTRVHPSVLERYEKDEHYRPPNLTTFLSPTQ